MATAAKTVTERGILMSGPMVRATLEDRKTQTRRTRGLELINEDPDRYKHHELDEDSCALFEDLKPEITPWIAPIKCPYGKPGDRLCSRHYGIIGEQEQDNHNGNTNERRSFAQANSGITERRLHGGRGRTDLLADSLQGFREESADGLVSAEGFDQFKGLSNGQPFAREQEGYEIGSSDGLHGVPWDARSANATDASQGRRSVEQSPRQSDLGDSRTELGRSSDSWNGLDWGETPDVKTDRSGAGTSSLGDSKRAMQPTARCESIRNVTSSDSERCTCGDRLWVRESFYAYGLWVRQGTRWTFEDRTFQTGHSYLYCATDPEPILVDQRGNIGWHRRPSIFIPRIASRITLEITNVRVERLNDISEEDAKAEGWGGYLNSRIDGDEVECAGNSPRTWFHKLWDNINGKRGFGWDKNPHVWVIEFKKI
jgi:hypothetical protein